MAGVFKVQTWDHQSQWYLSTAQNSQCTIKKKPWTLNVSSSEGLNLCCCCHPQRSPQFCSEPLWIFHTRHKYKAQESGRRWGMSRDLYNSGIPGCPWTLNRTNVQSSFRQCGEERVCSDKEETWKAVTGWGVSQTDGRTDGRSELSEAHTVGILGGLSHNTLSWLAALRCPFEIQFHLWHYISRYSITASTLLRLRVHMFRVKH